MSPGRTVADAMLRRPTLHPADLTVAEARAAFDASAKTHLLLLVEGGRLVGTLTRADLEGPLTPSSPAAAGILAGRVVGPDACLEDARERMVRDGVRRLAVVDSSMTLLGLLCLKRSRAGFCTDEGVARMRRDRVSA